MWSFVVCAGKVYQADVRGQTVAVKKLREEGYPVGFVRPITLWPFPAEILRNACRDAKAIAVHELNSGQMIEDVSLAVRHLPVFKTGGVSMDESGFGIAPDLTPTRSSAAAPANRPHSGEARPMGTRSRASGFARGWFSGAKDMAVSG